MFTALTGSKPAATKGTASVASKSDLKLPTEVDELRPPTPEIAARGMSSVPAEHGQQPHHDAVRIRSGRGTAVVIGGGIAGTLTAWALRKVADHVVVLERDRYPANPTWRAGVPQCLHAHLVLEAGHRVLEDMMPGVRQELLAAGAVSVAMSGPAGLRWLSSAGWMAEHDSHLSFLSCTRPLLDHTIRTRVAQVPSVEMFEACEVIGLLGSPNAVTGVRFQQRGCTQSIQEIRADWIVDASGRRSGVPRWLTELGCDPIPEERVDPGVAYTSRLYHRSPEVDPGFGALYIQTAPGQPRTGVLLPVEGDRWMVSLGGMRGAQPEPGDRGFEQALSQLRDPILREFLETTSPIGNARGFQPGPGVRRRYDYNTTPNGLVVVGDAADNFNPVYGQGVTVAAFGARAVASAIARHGGLTHTAARTANRRIAAAAAPAWLMSSSEDVRFPDTIGGPANAVTRAQHRLLDRVLVRATVDPRVTAAFHAVMSLTASPASLLLPTMLSPILSGKA